MENILDLCNAIGNSYFALRRAMNDGLQKGATRTLTYDDSQVLLALEDNKSLLVQDIAHIIDSSLPVTSRFIKRLEEKGFIVKKRGITDSRERVITLTESGRTACIEIRQTIETVLGACFLPLSAIERQELARMLQEIRRNSEALK